MMMMMMIIIIIIMIMMMMSLKLQTEPDKISCVLPPWLPVIVALLLSFLVEHMGRDGKKQRNLMLTSRKSIRPMAKANQPVSLL